MLLGLVSLGFMFAKKNDAAAAALPPSGAFGSPACADELAMKRRYSAATTIQNARDAELMLAQDAERAARYPMRTGAVDPRARAYGTGSPDAVVSDLAGVEFEAGDFRHNNMQPYFGSHVKSAGRHNSAILENFTGSPSPGQMKSKKEVEPFFPAGEMNDMNNVYGNQSHMNDLRTRLESMDVVNRIHNNELPFQQLKVGPGVGQGYTAAPSGGFGQNNVRDFVRYKDVDELRPGNKPKANLEGRINAGAAVTASRGLIGITGKNRPSTAFSIEGFEQIGTRAAAADGPTARSDPLHGRALKDPPSAFRFESAAGTMGAPIPVTADQTARFGPPKLDQNTPELTGAFRPGIGNAAFEDMHRTVQAPGQNERNKSNARWAADHEPWAVGQTPAAVLRSGPPGAVHVPGRDVRNLLHEGMRLSGKEITSDASDAHMFGNMAPQAPGRGPAYDPLVHRPKTTLKETQIHDERPGNYKNEHGPVAGEGLSSRSTVRETFCDTYETFAVRNPQPPMVQEGVGPPDADPRDHRMKTTAKEVVTTTCGPYVGGVAPSGAQFQAAGAYDVTATGIEEPKLTARQFTEQGEYFGTGGKPETTGYALVDDTMRTTMQKRNVPLSEDYFGTPADRNARGIDYEAIYTTTVNEAKQSLLKTRQPGGHGGAPAAAHSHMQGEVFARTNDPYVKDYFPAGDLPKNRGGVGSVAFQNNKGLSHDDRIDKQLLSYLKTNPLVINPAVRAHAESIK